MRHSHIAWISTLLGTGLLRGVLGASPQPCLDVVATAHLDTQWRWTIRDTVDEYIPRTLQDNFVLLERHPDYVFTFEGAFRYQLMRDYYPADFQRVKDYVRQGRWRLAGGWLDAVDVNIPSPESLYRHALYGNGWLEQEFGQRSRDVFLPDCFGFGYALPTVARHSGLVGFSTQKLGWGCAVGTPFDLGRWAGVDGSTLVAALNPGSYSSGFAADLSRDSLWLDATARLARTGGPHRAYKYFGTGDTGGAPDSASVDWLERSVRGSGPLRVRSAGSSQLMEELDGADSLILPRYQGELLMTRHGAGCYTSQAVMKRWNRQNEIWGDAAERAAALAHWQGVASWPEQALEQAWTRFLWHQFHDDLTGTSIPEAYAFSWSDELLSLNQFAQLTEEAVGSLAAGLDTRPSTPGARCLVLYNPLGQERHGLVKARLQGLETLTGPVQVTGPRGELLGGRVEQGELAFVCALPPLSVSVVDVLPLKDASVGLDEQDLVLENGRLRLRLGSRGIEALYDKVLGRELLSGPVEWQLLEDSPRNWPAWEVDAEDLGAAPREVAHDARWCRLGSKATGRLQAGESTLLLTVGLGQGAEEALVELDLEVDWRSQARLLKAAFPFNCANDSITYDLGCGVIRRGLNTAQLYEVPAQRWANVDAPDGSHGMAVLSTGPAGWDHPQPGLLRLSLVRTPEVNPGWRGYGDQATQDLGRHHFRLGLYAHDGDWREGVAEAADAFNQPVLAYEAQAHTGKGRQLSLGLAMEVDGSRDSAPVLLRSVRKARSNDELVLRLQESEGRAAVVDLKLAAPILAVRELNAAEEPANQAGLLELEHGTLRLGFSAFQPRTIALRLGKPSHKAMATPASRKVDLPWNRDVVGARGESPGGSLPGQSLHLPAEILPSELSWRGLSFATGPREPGAANALACLGQELALPRGSWGSVHLLVLALGEERQATFRTDELEQSHTVSHALGSFGQWDSRLGGDVKDANGVIPAWVKPGAVAWVGSYLLDSLGAVHSCETSVLQHLVLPLPKGCRSLHLPVDDRLLIMAATTGSRGGELALHPAFAPVQQTEEAGVRVKGNRRSFAEELEVELESPTPQARLYHRFTGLSGEVIAGEGRHLTLREGGTLEAWAQAPGLKPGRVLKATFSQLQAVAAVPRGQLKLRPGLWRDLRLGACSNLAEAQRLPISQSRAVQDVGLAEDGPAEDVALSFEGYLDVPQRGVYRLLLSSDDGSALGLHHEVAIDNDGLHGTSEVAAEFLLEPGLHPIDLHFFQHLGGAELRLEWERPDGVREAIPSRCLWHEPRSTVPE